MEKIFINSKDPTDASTLYDLLKVHFRKVDIISSTETGPIDCSKSLGGSGRNLYIEINHAEEKDQITVKVCYKDRCNERCYECGPKEHNEQEKNRQKRELRLAVLRTLDCPSFEISPWGILTGVRPSKVAHRLMDQDFSEEKTAALLQRDYALRQDKAELLCGIAAYQRRMLWEEKNKRAVGVYIGIPFCPTRCYYCSFPSYQIKSGSNLLTDYLESLKREIAETSFALKEKDYQVVYLYIGGGTPTVLSPKQLDDLFKCAKKELPIEDDCEISLEGGRPETIDQDKLEIMRQHNVQRLSINPQTMCEDTLKSIGREHTISDVYKSVKKARKIGIPVVNMDLIVGLPGENKQILVDTMNKTIALGPENITVHGFSIKRAAVYNKNTIDLPDWNEGQEMTGIARHKLCEAGYKPYYLYRQKDIFAHSENVGYALDDKICKYNIRMIEEKQTILGFGLGAGSKIIDYKNTAIENIYNPKDLVNYKNRLSEIINRKVDKIRSIV